MGLLEIIQESFKKFADYERHSVKYAAFSTTAGILGGAIAGVYAAAAGVNALYTSLAAMSGYIVSRVVVGVTTHLKNIYQFATGTGVYAKKEAPAPAAAPALAPAPA